jgi:RNA-directed DNA polymerase
MVPSPRCCPHTRGDPAGPLGSPSGEGKRNASLELGFDSKEAKTGSCACGKGRGPFDFLGFHHRYVRGRTRRSRNLTFLARWPSRQAMQHARDRIRELTARERLLLSVVDVVEDVNAFRGWGFRYEISARPLRQDPDLRARAALARRGKRQCKPRSYGGGWSHTSRRTGWA